MRNKGIVYLVTGAASGIGRKLVGLVAERGGSALATDVSDDALRSAMREDGWDPSRVTPLRLDVRAPEDWQRAVDEALRAFGRIDVLLNVAGYLKPGRTVETQAIDVDRHAESGADVFLAGHLHKSHIGNSARRYRLDNGYCALIIQAGTATSNRERGEENSFNLMEFDHPMLTVYRYTCPIRTEPFRLANTEHFTHDGRGWSRM